MALRHQINVCFLLKLLSHLCVHPVPTGVVVHLVKHTMLDSLSVDIVIKHPGLPSVEVVCWHFSVCSSSSQVIRLVFSALVIFGRGYII